MNRPKVSVIIPVYKVEKHIAKCCRSLFSQTLDNVEYIFIDDAGLDNSISVIKEVLEEFPERKENVKFIIHPENKGVSRSRQDGLDAATGEYIIHCDPDDYLDREAYEALYEKAKKSGADLVMCDFAIEKDGKISHLSQRPISLHHISLLQQMSCLRNPNIMGSTCNKLIRNEIAKKYRFPDDIIYCEDLYYLFMILNEDIKIEYIDAPFYHYVAHEESLVNSYNEKIFESDIRLMSKFKDLEKLNLSTDYGLCCNSFIGVILRNKALNYSGFDKRRIKRETKPFRKNLLRSNQLKTVPGLLTAAGLYLNFEIFRRLNLSLRKFKNQISSGI